MRKLVGMPVRDLLRFDRAVVVALDGLGNRPVNCFWIQAGFAAESGNIVRAQILLNDCLGFSFPGCAIRDQRRDGLMKALSATWPRG
jgi:hypothetical protein